MSSAHQLFIGRLPLGCRSKDLEDIFYRYGKMNRCDVKQGMKMAYGFIEYEDKRDAEDALQNEHGTEILGSRIIVEWSHGNKEKPKRDRDGGRDYGYGRGGRSRNNRDYRDHYEDRGRSPERRSPGYRDRSPRYDERRSPAYRDRSPYYDERHSPGYRRDRSPYYDERRSPGYRRDRSPYYDDRRSPGYRDDGRGRHRGHEY